MLESKQLDLIKQSIRTIPDWPKTGIQFRDITTLLYNPDAFGAALDIFEARYRKLEIDVIAGIESRGFILGAPLADRLKKPFVPIRKKGKLPYKTISHTYNLEYGSDCIEMHADSVTIGQKVLLVDDLLATGGTLIAGATLIKSLGAQVVECAVVVDLPEIGGRDKLSKAGLILFHLVEFEGE